MKRRIQILALLATVLLAVRLMAQDTGGGGGGAGGGSGGGGDMSGASQGTGGGGDQGNTGGNGGEGGQGGTGGNNGTTGEGNPLPSGGGTGGENNNGTQPGGGSLFAPGGGTGEGGSLNAPGATPSPSPGASPSASPTPSATPTPSPTPFNANTQTTAPSAPVSFSLPGAYGGSAPQSLTLGEGRLALPPITFSLSVSQGYDDNIFDSPSNPQPGPTPFPQPTPPLERELIGFRIAPPSPPTPVFRTFRPKALATPTPTPSSSGLIASPVSTAALGMQIQKGTPRTVLTMSANISAQDYWNEPGGGNQYTGSFDLQAVHRLSPRATVTMESDISYQQTPNFSLVNAPTNTNNNGGSFLNGFGKIDLTYAWSKRFSTVTSYNYNINIEEQNSSQDLYGHTFGNQFRYTVSARDTVTAELRESIGVYPNQKSADNNSTYYLVGLDSNFSSRLRSTVSFGIQDTTYPNANAPTQSLPYLETGLTLILPHASQLTWTNNYGSQGSGNAELQETAYRTTLGFSKLLSPKLQSSVSVAYNYLENKDIQTSAGNYTQSQFQMNIGLNYQISPRLSVNLNYTRLDLLSSQINGSYDRDQIFLGGSYTFQ